VSQEIIKYEVPEAIARIQTEMVNMPQATNTVTTHYLVPGLYCRKLWRQADTTIVGKIHKKAHLFMCVEGEILAYHDGVATRLLPGDVIECKPGTKRVTHAVKDSIGITVHPTDKTNLEDIEEDLIQSEDGAKFDFNNELKHNTVEVDEQEAIS